MPAKLPPGTDILARRNEQAASGMADRRLRRKTAGLCPQCPRNDEANVLIEGERVCSDCRTRFSAENRVKRMMQQIETGLLYIMSSGYTPPPRIIDLIIDAADELRVTPAPPPGRKRTATK